MNLSNIWQHPKTSVAGVLIAVFTVVGVLSQQGITLGNAGTGTVVALIGAICTALLGLLAKDPESASGTVTSISSTQKLGALALCAILTVATMPMQGCTQQQKISVAQEIVNWTPTFISTADLVNSSIEALDPATALLLGPLTVAINAFGPQFEIAAKNYLASPSETNLQALQALITQIQQNTNQALLAAAKITNSGSQATATKDIGLIATIANTLLGLVQSISTKAQIAAMARPIILIGSPTPQHITLAQVRPYLDLPAMQAAGIQVSRDLALNHIVTPDEFFGVEAQKGF